MKLWGKTMAELDADHRRMLADRLAREQNATPQQLGQYYGDSLRPHKPTQQERLDDMVRETAVRRDYYFGTDIPIEDAEMDEWLKVEAERAKHGEDDAGHTGTIVIWGLVVMLACMGFLVITAALK